MLKNDWKYKKRLGYYIERLGRFDKELNRIFEYNRYSVWNFIG